MTPPVQFGPRYDSTRQAWENIWDTASVERELQEMNYPRAENLFRFIPNICQKMV